jgi:hypothetical protein
VRRAVAATHQSQYLIDASRTKTNRTTTNRIKANIAGDPERLRRCPERLIPKENN